jgi:hypothetical protein
MRFKELDVVAITVDLPVHGLKTGDVGTVVAVYGSTAVEVEFVTATGATQAVLTLPVDEVRAVGARDMLAARPVDAA